jgi:hypothetical protein
LNVAIGFMPDLLNLIVRQLSYLTITKSTLFCDISISFSKHSYSVDISNIECTNDN